EVERTIPLEADGSFRFVLDSKLPQTGTLTYFNIEFPLFISPGDSLFFEVNFSGTRMSSSFSGRGDGNHTAYLLIRQEFEHMEHTDLYLSKLPRNTTPFSFDREVRRLQNEQFNFLGRMADMQLSPLYVSVEKNNIRYRNALLKHNFFMTYTLDNGGRYEDYWAQSVEQLIQAYGIESPYENGLFSPAYREYLKLVLEYYYKKEHPESGVSKARSEQIERKWKLIEEKFPRDMHDYLYAYLILGKYPDLTKPIYTALSQGEYQYWQERYREVSKNRTIWKLIEDERIDRYGDGSTNVDVVTPESLSAVNFLELDMTALETFTYFVNQNSGKVILVDMWASWCQPCLAVAPQLRALQDEYKNEDITYLFVSFDKEREKMRKSAWKNRLQGTHMLSEGGFSSDLAEQFGIFALPHYMLIDKEGQIRFMNASSPAAEEVLRSQINSLLY
ncbi:MAG: TlpA family protein disulfide reductase, partial [Bacteroidota bacterium]